MALNRDLVLGALAAKSRDGVGARPGILEVLGIKETTKDLLEVGGDCMFRRRIHLVGT